MSKSNKSKSKKTVCPAAAKNHLSNLSVSIYPGYALVQGNFGVHLEKGENHFQLQGFPTSFDPASVHVDSFEGPGAVTLHSTSFRPANLNAQAMQERALNQDVVIRYNSTSGEKKLKGTLLSLYGNMALIKTKKGKIEQIHSVAGFTYDNVPQGLANTPSLSMKVDAEEAGEYTINLFYKANNFSWKADYKMTLDEKSNTVGWDASVLIENSSGASYEGAMLKVVAGDSGAEADSFEGGYESAPRMYAMAAAAPGGGARAMSKNIRSAQSESVGQVKSYTIGKADIPSGDHQKVPFSMAEAVPVKREGRVGKIHGWHARDGKMEQPVRNLIIFQNDAASHLGSPLPAGMVSVMTRDSAGALLKSGGGRMEDTAVGQEVRLDTGSDFDLKASRRVADKQSVKGPKLTLRKKAQSTDSDEPQYQKVHHDHACEVELFNGKAYPAELVVEEFLDTDCEFLGDHGMVKVGASDYEIRLVLQPGEKKVIKYTIRQTLTEAIADELFEEESSEEGSEGGEGTPE